MGTFVALDVAIGLVFMYLLLAILCTAINEWIAGVFRLRATNLKSALARLLDAPGQTGPRGRPKSVWSRLFGQRREAEEGGRLATGNRLSDRIWTHPLIDSMKDGRRGPSYIPAPRFVAAFLDLLSSEPTEPSERTSVEQPPRQPLFAADVQYVKGQLSSLAKTPPPKVRAAMSTEGIAAAKDAGTDETDRVEEWFNQAMERSTGWYRRKLMFITLVVAAVLTVFSNADTIAAARILWQNPTIRAAVVAQAQQRAQKPRPSDATTVVQAEYPDKDKPISDMGAGELEEDNPEDANTAGKEENAPIVAGPITDEEQAALGQFIGWSRDFRASNAPICAERQRKINEACKVGAEPSPECTRAIDQGTANGICVVESDGLVPTEAFPTGLALWSLFGAHAVGWFITAMAVSMGAPFWFDTLKLFMSVRSSGKNPEEQKK